MIELIIITICFIVFMTIIFIALLGTSDVFKREEFRVHYLKAIVVEYFFFLFMIWIMFVYNMFLKIWG